MSLDEDRLRGLARGRHAGWDGAHVERALAGVAPRRRRRRVRAVALATTVVAGVALAGAMVWPPSTTERSEGGTNAFTGTRALDPGRVPDRSSRPPPALVGAAARTATGRFVIEGARVWDPDGRPFVAKGVNVNGPHWVWPGDVTRDATSIVEHWRFNQVRVLMMAVPRPSSWSDNNDLARLVQTFTERRVVVVIAPRDVTAARWNEPAFRLAYTTWLRAVATRYRENPYVWFEVSGTERSCDPPHAGWLERAEALLNVVRKEAGADNVFVVAGAGHGADIGCRPAAEPLRIEDSAILSLGPRLMQAVPAPANVLFAVAHVCAVEVNARKLHAFLDEAETRGMAVTFSDLGNGDGQSGECTTGLRAVYAVAAARRIGRTGVRYWYHASPGPNWRDALTRTANGTTGAAIDDPVKPRNLSALGELVWSDTHRDD